MALPHERSHSHTKISADEVMIPCILVTTTLPTAEHSLTAEHQPVLFG